MFGLGSKELLIILGIIVLFVGGRKLPELGRGLGNGIRSFRRAIKGDDSEEALEKRSVD